MERLFPTERRPGVQFTDCMFGSPLLYATNARAEVLLAVGDRVAALDPYTGELIYDISLPAPTGERPFAVSTPVLVGDRLVVAYHTTTPETESHKPGRDVMDPRVSQIVAVLDLANRTVDPAFPFVQLAAQRPAFEPGQWVTFRSDKALQRATLIHLAESDSLGRVYVTFGNARDLQPWHGWAFAVSLDAWRSGGAAAAVEAVLLTTPEHDCGPEGPSGSTSRICGGGLWAPSGPLLVNRRDGYELILAPGNGQLDLRRGDYANTLMRVGTDLSFDPGCDLAACENFDPDQPSLACIESCKNLFVPRIPAGDAPLLPESRVCDELTMFQCWEKLDYIGGSTPVHLELETGESLLAYPTKDGHVYLVDGEHLGTLYDREKLTDVCGTESDPCELDWAGMIVTQPALGTTGDRTILVVPTFMPDRTHAAGVFGLEVVDTGGRPRVETRWRYPDSDSREAKSRFRLHPSRAKIGPSTLPEPVVFLVEPGESAVDAGTLTVLGLGDGRLLAETQLAGRGMRYVEPLIVNDVVYTPSCQSDFGTSTLEAHRFASQ